MWLKTCWQTAILCHGFGNLMWKWMRLHSCKSIHDWNDMNIAVFISESEAELQKLSYKMFEPSQENFIALRISQLFNFVITDIVLICSYWLSSNMNIVAEHLTSLSVCGAKATAIAILQYFLLLFITNDLHITSCYTLLEVRKQGRINGIPCSKG